MAKLHWSVILAIVLGSVAVVGVLALAIAFGVSPGASHTRLFSSVRGVHPPVRAASTRQHDPSFVPPRFFVDGILMQNGDRVLLKDQENETQNGIYIVGQPLQRAGDFKHSKQIAAGNTVYVQEGNRNRHVTFRLHIDEQHVDLGHTAFHWIKLIDSLFYKPPGEDYVLTSSSLNRRGTRWKHVAGLLNLHEDQKDLVGIGDPSDPGGLRFEDNFKVHTNGLQLPLGVQAVPAGNPDGFMGYIPVMVDNAGVPTQGYLWVHTTVP